MLMLPAQMESSLARQDHGWESVVFIPLDQSTASLASMPLGE